jgi:hypothetical protein
MTSPTPSPWPFGLTLRLTGIALLLAMVSLTDEGWIGDVLMVLAILLAIWGVFGYLRAWRARGKLTNPKG